MDQLLFNRPFQATPSIADQSKASTCVARALTRAAAANGRTGR
mgnify:CR=1 FL=1